MKRVLFLSGWAVDRNRCRPFLSEKTEFFDTTAFLPRLLTGERLLPAWEDIVCDSLTPYASDQTTLIAWSSGAFVALAAAKKLPFHGIRLYSAGQSFLQRPGLPGTKPQLLARMKDTIRTDRDQTLKNFYASAGMAEEPLPGYTEQVLYEGLCFLEQVYISDLPEVNTISMICHGTKDRILPWRAGKKLAEMLHADFYCPPVPHFCPAMKNDL
jgi:predicted esterase